MPLDKYIYGDKEVEDNIRWLEPHKPDPWKDIPILVKGMEVAPWPPRAAMPRPEFIAARRRRREAFRNDFMEDSQRPESLFRSNADSILGNSVRAVREVPSKPLLLRPARAALRDMEAHEAKIGGIKKLARLEKEVATRRKAREDALASGEAPKSRKKAAEEWIVMMKRAGQDAKGNGVREADADKPVEPFSRVIHRDYAFRNNVQVLSTFLGPRERARFSSEEELPAITKLSSPERMLAQQQRSSSSSSSSSGGVAAARTKSSSEGGRFRYQRVPLHAAIPSARGGPPKGVS